jgi:hypothetical protein
MPAMDDMQPKRFGQHQVLGGVLLVAVVIVLAVLVWPGQPLVGEQEFDFGKVVFDQVPHTVEHTFSLENTSRSPVTIERSTSTCGCTQAVTPREVIEPGGFLDVPVRLKLSQTGLKQGTITVLLHSGRRIPLVIKANARPKNSLRADPVKLVLRPGNDNMVRVQLNADEQPPDPVVAKIEGMTVTMSPWEKSKKAAPHLERPAIWQSLLLASVTEDIPMENPIIAVTVEGEGTLELPVGIIWPWGHARHPETQTEPTEETDPADQ